MTELGDVNGDELRVVRHSILRVVYERAAASAVLGYRQTVYNEAAVDAPRVRRGPRVRLFA